MNRLLVFALITTLVVTAGCQEILNGSEPTPETQTMNSPAETATSIRTQTIAQTKTVTPTATPVDETRKAHLEEFARVQERVFIEETNLTNVQVFRESGTANLTVSFGLPAKRISSREQLFERILRALVQSQYNWVTNNDESYQADYITVKTDYGNASVSKELLQLYIDGKLDYRTVAYIWAGKFDRFTALGDLDNASHTSRTDRLAYTARIVARNMENEKPYVKNVETEVEDETLYVKLEYTDETPNPAWAIEDTVRAYRETVTEFGVEYMPYDGVRGYAYHQNGTADVTFIVSNIWITSEYVGLRPMGEGSLGAGNSLEFMDGPHEGPP